MKGTSYARRDNPRLPWRLGEKEEEWKRVFIQHLGRTLRWVSEVKTSVVPALELCVSVCVCVFHISFQSENHFILSYDVFVCLRKHTRTKGYYDLLCNKCVKMNHHGITYIRKLAMCGDIMYSVCPHALYTYSFADHLVVN